MHPRHEPRSGPLTESERSGLKPGLDVDALQELLDALPPYCRSLLLAKFASTKNPEALLDAMDEIADAVGAPRQDRAPLYKQHDWVEAPGGWKVRLEAPAIDMALTIDETHPLYPLLKRVEKSYWSDA